MLKIYNMDVFASIAVCDGIALHAPHPPLWRPAALGRCGQVTVSMCVPVPNADTLNAERWWFYHIACTSMLTTSSSFTNAHTHTPILATHASNSARMGFCVKAIWHLQWTHKVASFECEYVIYKSAFVFLFRCSSAATTHTRRAYATMYHIHWTTYTIERLLTRLYTHFSWFRGAE